MNQIFSDLDTIAEVELFRVGRFYQTLLSMIPLLEHAAAVQLNASVTDATSDDAVDKADNAAGSAQEGLPAVASAAALPPAPVAPETLPKPPADASCSSPTAIRPIGSSAKLFDRLGIQKIEVKPAGASAMSKLRDAELTEEASASKSIVANEVIEVCRRKGRVSKDLLVELIKQAKEVLSALDNMVELTVAEGERLTVVSEVSFGWGYCWDCGWS